MKKIIILLAIIIITGCKRIEKLKIELLTSPTTGYKWSYNISNDIIEIKEEYDDSNCKKESMGCGGKNIYTITPKEQGTTTIDFEYCFVGIENCINAKYELNIDEKLKITETHTGTYFRE